ncbi:MULTISPECIES: D-mannonate oxidoreductase [unclassified Roseateles]|uniref:mannitol dehydrogenase family protein n=1 Tax=unclassified Roseateles TaxID=2626991 RepID=UPI0006FD8CAA|nr:MULTISPECIES: D-mannonate oxidoreductase [unclassified Roseateles]KQW49767.1 D-mannonate oxidoreductase [Pelomonas sp. Root405]KRA76434.1 D-mannonate oxidoreductase [Pelomonas sp. Root662]
MLTAAGHPILQFGTSRFLQAHVDLFVSEAAETGEALGGITVVQSTGNPASTRRTQALARAEGFDVIVRGLVGGQPLESRKTCRAVREAFHAASDWPAVRERVRGPVQVIVSNTGDGGWTLDAGDAAPLLAPDATAPASFPAKLLVLLHGRWQAQPHAGLTLLPCELVSRNGDALRNLVLTLACQWQCAPAFIAWLQTGPVWANSLVDRIVSEALEPVGAVAEPYALWAVETQPRLQLPCRHPAIVITDDLGRHERLKLFLLNLGHTLLAELWMKGHLPADMTVLQAMQAPALRDPLEAAWQQEVLPVFDALGQGDEARSYLVGLRDRLLNPFLAHRLADIAQNHALKKARRLQPVVDLARQHLPGLRQPLLLAALA